MKTLAIILMLAVLAIPAVAQTTGPDEYIFTGGLYDNSAGFSSLFGVAARVEGGWWAMTRLTFGQPGGSFEPDFAYLWNLNGFIIGPIAAPNADFVGGADPVTYITGAAGGVIGYNSKGKPGSPVKGWGIYGVVKGKWALDGQSGYQNGVQVAVAAAVGF